MLYWIVLGSLVAVLGVPASVVVVVLWRRQRRVSRQPEPVPSPSTRAQRRVRRTREREAGDEEVTDVLPIVDGRGDRHGTR
ncbi:hypothetical protein J2S53_001324 [Actinopolyspora lacussalsi]|nr:hypothetical protein [Actinopolyspora lacussalsi]